MEREATAEAGVRRVEKQTIAERLEAIEEQGRLTLELVKTLVGLLMPKDDKDGPSLEDLIAAVVAQLRDLLILARATRSDVKQLGETLPPAVVEALGDSVVPTRVSRS